MTQISFKRGQYPPEWQSQIWLLETGDKGVSMLRNIQGKWCKKRHPNKPWKWIREKYFSASGELCTFASVRLFKKQKVRINKIFRLAYIPIIRHVKIKAKSNPFDINDQKYFKQRFIDLKVKSSKTKQNCIALKNVNDINRNLLNLWNIQPECIYQDTFRNARAA
ncbi:hypothetical protein [Alkalitalea saponilacus]|uniref:hypothetical protein n=1 Tax=Alkalitalea saponilacus TaxID=889453 RepID=UPI0012FC37EC|nr:hypothetical protein [Alkalitalea saponilacus]